MSNFCFSTFTEKLDKKITTDIEDQYGLNYVHMIVQNQLHTSEIDFNKFSLDDLINALDGLEEAITDEDQNGNLAIDPNHVYTRVLALSFKIDKLGTVPKLRGTSPFLFL